MMRTINVAEHNLFADPPKVITVNAATATAILPNEAYVATGEIAYRYIQNTGANDCFYSFGLSNANTNPTQVQAPVTNATTLYHGYLPIGAQLDCSNHRLRVDVYSTAGTVISTTVIRRRDQAKHQNTRSI